ncbi:MAG: hypothetical protein CMH57_05565 [Myxococcales bacterium]|nr:hypothetical protein [Myxococcales bacterium]
MTLPPSEAPEARRYLDQVARALHRSGADPFDRDAILDGLREQIDDLGADLGDVVEAIQRLDPPHRFGAALPPPPTTALAPPLHTLGALSLASCMLGLLLGVSIGVAGGLVGVSGGEAGYVLFFGAQLLAIGLGIASVKHPLGRGGLVAAALLLSSSLVLPTLFA